MSSIEVLRSFRVGPFAVFDFAASFVAMYIIGLYFGRPWAAVYAVIPLSVLAHVLTGKQTPLTQMATGPGFYWVKIGVLVLAYMALTKPV